jgi:hypothetical protein
MLTFPTLITGTITGLRISSVNGTAFLDNCAALIPYADGNHQIEIYDSSNRMLKGVLKAAGTSETVSETDVFAGFDFTSGWACNNATITGAKTFTMTASAGGPYKSSVLIAGALYKSSLVGTVSVGTLRYYTAGALYILCPNNTSDYYATVRPDNGVAYFLVSSSSNGATAEVVSATSYQVTAPSSSGATITTLKNGDVYNFSYKNASFTYNASSYYVIIRAIR